MTMNSSSVSGEDSSKQYNKALEEHAQNQVLSVPVGENVMVGGTRGPSQEVVIGGREEWAYLPSLLHYICLLNV